MICRNCGKEITSKTAKFCTSCGTPVGEAGEMSVEETDTAPKKKSKTWLIIAAAVILFLISGALSGFFFTNQVNKENEALTKEIESEQNTYLSFAEDATAYKEKFSHYYLDDSDQEEFNSKIKAAKNYIESRDTEDVMKTWLSDMKKFQEETEEKNETYMNTLTENIEGYNLLLATEEEEKKFKEYQKTFETAVKNREYNQAAQKAQDCCKYGEQITTQKDGWNVEVLQQDISSYPTIRLYLDITDSANEVVENLNKNIFILSEKQAEDKDYVKQKIQKATQLDQSERLNISLLADVSGSMDYNLPRVKSVISSFLEDVQFDVGDQIELACFDDDYYIMEYFTDNRQELISAAESLELGDMTKLYDSLIESVQRVYLQEGARCVIAFTDGMDNASASDADDVISYANRYNVPIFIIGIGLEGNYEYSRELQNIAERTGGFYRNVEEVSDNMKEIYNAIYRQQKEVYCLEYKTQNGLEGTKEVSVYIKGDQYGGMTDYSYTPKEDYFNYLLGKCLNAYSDAVANKDYSYLKNADILQEGGGMEKEWKSYVMKKDLEQSRILHSEILDIKSESENTYLITTRETYDITQTKDYDSDIKKKKDDSDNKDAWQIYDLLDYNFYEEQYKGKKIIVKKQRVLKGCYRVVKNSDGSWKFKDFAKNYEVESSDVYYAVPEGENSLEQ